MATEVAEDRRSDDEERSKIQYRDEAGKKDPAVAAP